MGQLTWDGHAFGINRKGGCVGVVSFEDLVHDRLASMAASFPDDVSFDDATASWNYLAETHPVGVVAPCSTSQVQEVIRCAREAGVMQLAIRSGGHSFEGGSLGGRDGHAVVIDMIEMNDITIDRDALTATVGGGTLLGDLTVRAWEQGGLMLPGGNCVAVGIAGQAQCGGYGHYARTHGIQVDRLLEVQMVLADGSVVVADKHHNADLFWAIRGSGTGSYGVITQLTVRLNKAPAAPANFVVKYPLTDTGSFIRTFTALQDYSLHAPLTFNPMIVIWRERLSILGCLATDTEADREALIADMREKLPATEEFEIQRVDYLETMRQQGLTDTSAPFYPDLTDIRRERREHLRYMKIKAGFVPEPFTDEFIRKLARHAVTQPSDGVRIQLLGLDPNSGLPVEATAVKNRGCPWLMGMSSAIFLDQAGDIDTMVTLGKQRDQWLHEAYEIFYPILAGGYIGDDDYEEGDHGRDMFASYYGEHLPRLKAIKRKYDPDNLFHHKLSIPLG
ncbi:FAD-binding oxidoreductase [Nocardia brasiliensis]|uniref:FAD-binding oxidoreductase n=1 Tax=Nocardia brasiliensis TaxID=37326 RepID=UPI0006920657|nr:FAD-binding oxidoreductase [Nocardia brasiliensis]